MAAKKKKKKTTLKSQASSLAKKQFAGALAEIKGNQKSNESQYAQYVKQRTKSLEGQLGSIGASGTITRNVIGGLKGEALDAIAKGDAGNKAIQAAAKEASTAENTNALEKFKAEMQARGIQSGGMADQMAANFSKTQGYSDQLANIRNMYTTDNADLARQLYDTLTAQATLQENQNSQGARAQAQGDFNTQFNSYSARRDELSTALTKTKLEQGNAQTNIYLTLKKEYEQRKAEAAAAKLSAAVSMSKQASSDYFRQANLDIAQARLENDIANSAYSQAQKAAEAAAKAATASRAGDPYVPYMKNGKSTYYKTVNGRPVFGTGG